MRWLTLLFPLIVLADGQKFSVSYPASEKDGELVFPSTYNLWIPEGVKTIRTIIVHQHGCGAGSNQGAVTAADDLHWQALARKWDGALLGPVIQQPDKANCQLWCDPRHGSEQAFLKALQDLATQTHHPEITEAPWCLWGHSGGGFWASIMQTRHASKIVAIWFRSGTAYLYWHKSSDGHEPANPIAPLELSAEALSIPMMCNPGTKENGDARFNGAWVGCMEMFKAYRAQGAPIGFAPDPKTSHQCGDQRYAAIAFFDSCLELRLPTSGNQLRLIDQTQGRIAPLLGQQTAPANSKPDLQASWMPTKFAPTWEQYVTTGIITDQTPPPAPFSIKTKNGEHGLEITWDAHADLESGLQEFIIQKNGQTIAHVPSKPTNPFGKPLFQGMSYGDTPAPKAPEMRYVDANGKSSDNYKVIAVNTAGLNSP
jgi:hypothetical protein